MNIVYFHWNRNNGPSIVKSFRPLINKIKETENVEEYYVPYRGASPLKVFKNILFIYKHRTEHGINHITGDIHYGILGLIGCKSVLTIHDDAAMQTAIKGFFDKIYKWLFWFYLPIKFANKITCISEETKERIDKIVKNKKTFVLFQHTFDNFMYTPQIFNSDCPIVLQVGIIERKNLETTLKALSGLSCKLRVIKKMTDEQHQLAKSLGINYTNLYDLSDEEILNEYVNSDIVVFPSLFEGFGMPIIEGQAIGRVVITSNMPPMNTVAGKGAVLLNNPFDVTEYKNALLMIIKDEIFREKLIQEGLKNVKRYTVNESVQRFFDMYCSIQ